MTKKFILYSFPFILIFLCVAVFEPWIYRNLVVSGEIDATMKEKYVEVIAHKGASALAPENTLASFEKAINMGVDMIELDVRHTKDEEVVVIHDETLNRTTNGTGQVYDYTLQEIRKLDAGSWFDPMYNDQKVPTLKEVLDLVAGRCKVLIEIKHMDHPHYDDFAEKLVEVVRSEKNGYDWVILQSYENEYLEAIHNLDEKVQTKKLLIGEDSTPLIAFYIETRVHLGRAKLEGDLSSLNPEYTTLSTRRIFRMHAHGFKVYTYPVNTREDMVKMMHMGVDGIITDHPEIMLQIRKDIADL